MCGCCHIVITDLHGGGLTVYVCSNGLSDENLAILNQWDVHKYNAEIRVIDVNADKYIRIYKEFNGNTGANSITALIKFDLPAYIPEDKVLYLDCDILARKDISDLFEIDFDDKVACVVRDSGKIYQKNGLRGKLNDYFNSGVMLLNLDYMRKNHMTEKLIESKISLDNNKLVDQDAFNMAFHGLTKLLPIRYNALMINLHNSIDKFSMNQLNDFYKTNYSCIYDLEEDVRILHFASKEKPWLNTEARYSKEWAEVCQKSPLAEKNAEDSLSEKNAVETVPIIMATDIYYLPQTSVTMLSVLENGDKRFKYKFYILMPDGIVARNMSVIENVIRKYPNASVEYINMGNRFSDATLNISHITSPTFYRLNAPSLFPQYDKIIYLDSDVVVDGDLHEFYSLDIENYYVGGVKAASYHSVKNGNATYCKNNGLPAIDQYINAGVILLNLKTLREDDVEKEFEIRVKKGFRSQDQDVINGACYGHIKLLPYKYNCMITKYEGVEEQLLNCFRMQEILEAHNRPITIHYAAEEKPWKTFDCALADRWWKYARMAGVELAFLENFRDEFINRGKIIRFQKWDKTQKIKHQNEKLNKKLSDMRSEYSSLQHKNKKLNKKLSDIRNGYSFRIGRIVTWCPRKLRGGINCVRQHGVGYTAKRMLEHWGIDMGTGDFVKEK